MKKLTQKLVLSVVTMALVVIALGTSTFAWFTLTNSASVGPFEAQITAGEGIEVTLGTVDSNSVWYTVLPKEIIEAYIVATYSDSFRFTDVTTQDGVTFQKYNWATSTLDNFTEGFITLPLTFRSRTQQDIVWSSAVLGGTSQTWTVNVGQFTHNGIEVGTIPANKTIVVAAWTAARISVEGDLATKDVTDPENPVYNSVGNDAIVYQAPAAAGSTSSPISAFNSTADLAAYNFTKDTAEFLADGVTANPTYNKYIIGTNAFGAGDYTLAAGKSLVFDTDPTLTLSPKTAVTALTANDAVMTLQTKVGDYYQNQLMVRVWIEGWDADAFDALFNRVLSVQLTFGTKATPTV